MTNKKEPSGPVGYIIPKKDGGAEVHLIYKTDKTKEEIQKDYEADVARVKKEEGNS